jgi:hypothetical protein
MAASTKTGTAKITKTTKKAGFVIFVIFVVQRWVFVVQREVS